MNFGSLAGGLAEGLGSGYRTGMLADNLRNQREMDQRRVGIMEANAQQQRELADLQKQQHQRQLDRETRAEEAHKMAIAALTEGTDAPLDRNASAGSQIGQVILSTNALNDPRRLRAALNIYREAGMAKEAEEYLGHLKNAQEQNVLPALQALRGGDYEGAGRIYSQMGIKAKFSPGAAKGKYRVDYDGDGTFEERDLDIDEMSVRGYDGYVKAKQAALDAANKAETHKAEIELKQADAANKRGDNPTKIKIAEINANRSNKGRGRGAGGGAGGGDDGGPDMLDATRRVQIQKDVDEFVRSNFGTPDPVTGDPAKARHNDNSRRLSTIAAQLMMAAENGGKPMTIQDAGRLATEGRAVYGGAQVDPKGRLVAQQSWEVNGQVYPMGAATRALGKEEVLEYLDTTRARAIESGKTITPDMLKEVPIDQWAKQAGMKPQELVDRLVNGPKTVTESPPGRVPNQGGSGGGIISGAEAGEPGGAGAAASGRGIASESADVSKAKDLDRRIQALEARGDLLPESAKKQLADLKAQRKGTGISSAQIQAADLQGEIRNLEEAIVRLKKTDTGFDKRRSEQIKRLEAQRDQMRARLGGAATSGISREQMR